jgi:hypothetical protein
MTNNVTAVATKIDWSSLSGVTLDGGYELKEVLDGRDQAAKLRVRILGSGGRTGLAYFLHLEQGAADDQLDIWQTLRAAPHPNLNRPVAVGRREVAGFHTIFLVLADADEKLAAVVPERPLEWEEAAEVLHSCEKGLAHLHAHGLIHGSLSPQNVEAVGYSVQLNTEDVRRLGRKPRVVWNKPQYLAPESKEANLTTAADVWCLGATVFEVLAQERYGSPGAELEKGLPLAAVIQRCLDKNPATRCTLKEAPTISETIADVPPPAAAPPAPVAPEPVVTTKPAPQSRAPITPVAPPYVPPAAARVFEAQPPSQGASGARLGGAGRMPHPLTPKVTIEDMALVPVGKRHKKVEKRQPIGARIRTLDEPERVFAMGEATAESYGTTVGARILTLGNRPNLIRNVLAAAGLAILFAAAVWLIIIPKLQSTEEPLTSNVSAQTTTDAAHDVRFPQPADSTPPPPVPASSSSSATEAQDTPIVPIPKRELFRVIIASFDNRGDALHELELLAQLHPEFVFETVLSKADATDIRYSITVGGLLNRGEADALLQRVLARNLKTAHIELAKR